MDRMDLTCYTFEKSLMHFIHSADRHTLGGQTIYKKEAYVHLSLILLY